MHRLLIVGLIAAIFFGALILPRQTGAVQNRKAAQPVSSSAQSVRPGTGGVVQTVAGRPVSTPATGFAVSDKVSAIAKSQGKRATKKAAEPFDREELIEKQREKNALSAVASSPSAKSDSSYLKGAQTFNLFENSAEVEREMNPFNREVIREIDEKAPGTPDAAIANVPSTRKGARGISPRVMPPPNVSFNGIGNPEGCGGCLPPDTNGDIGPTQYVQTVNTAWRIFSRTGTALTPTMTLGSLFASLPGPCANTNDGDPIVMYDQLADRWVISEFCVSVANPNNHQLIAVSKTGDATGAYYLYDFMMPNNKFNDYPHFGVWPDGYYMTDNQFNQAGTAFQGAGVFAFDRVKMLAGDPTASFIYFDKAEGCAGAGATCLFGGMLPTDLDGFAPPPAGAPNSIIQFEADEFGNGQVDSLRILDFHADFVTPANSTITNHAGSPLSVAAFDPREVPSGSRNVVPQPAGVPLDVISDRLMFRLAYRNFGTHESLVMNHSVNALTNPAFRAGVRYYEIRKSTSTSPWTVQEQATMAGAVGDLEHRWMGSTAQNAAGSQAVGYSVSSSTTFPSVRYAGRLATDPAGSLAQGEATLVAGTGAQTSTSGRWGDYSDLTVDPLDDCTFWYTTEYYSATSGSNWATRIGSFTFGTCPAIQKGVLNGTVTSAATGVPINGASVVASNGFGRATNASGVYSIDPMAVGTVTLTISAPGYVTATVPNVSVTLGNTTTQNIQLTPLSNIVAGTGAVTADSCNSNQTLDPNEVVTVNLSLLNTGGSGASTTNLVATLQATGGVTNPSGPQSYGAVVSGQPAVTRAFTFTVAASCGGTVTATLQLQDGATDLGTRTFTFTVGTLSQITRTSGPVTVPIPDNLPTGVDVPITVPDTVAISDINVRVRLNHTFDSDLAISLVHPDGTSVALSNNRGGSGDNFGTGANDCTSTPTVFDDQATTTIAAGAAPFAGSFKPDGSLAALNGKQANGTWKLHVVDNASIDTGTIGCVTLEINTKFVCCGAQIVAAPPAVITAESVSPANNAIDPNEIVTVNFPVINTGGSNTTNLVGTLQATGGVLNPSGPQNYGVVVSNGPSVARPFTFTTNVACGGTITATLALQDGATVLTPVTFTFPVGTTSASAPQAFSNTTSIVIPAPPGTGTTGGAPATPYPSNIVVSGLSGNISKVTVGLNNLNHTFPSDVDMLLVGPGGQSFIILSDVIGGTDWVNINYTLDDAAAAVIPGTGAPASGTFKPTNYGTGDGFPAPAPAGPYQNPATAGAATFASVFNGTSANGTWSLYVVDDAATDAGTMTGGWTLNITTTMPVCNTQSCTLTCPANIVVPPDPGQSGAIVNYPAPNATGSCGVVSASPASGSFFPSGVTTVTVNGAGGATCQFTVTVQSPAATPVIISELRTSGPGGLGDDFVEMYNNTNSPLTVAASDASAGFGLFKMGTDCNTAPVLIATIPNGTVIPARGHFLVVGGQYSLANYGGTGA
ncbi:MAG: proprotein convertase P-domain-containing protein, partial [Acidobacteria bacterium]|nr:proprotein convertase P-domain-containing protein [Acidobacteriota bacterium]